MSGINNSANQNENETETDTSLVTDSPSFVI